MHTNYHNVFFTKIRKQLWNNHSRLFHLFEWHGVWTTEKRWRYIKDCSVFITLDFLTFLIDTENSPLQKLCTAVSFSLLLVLIISFWYLTEFKTLEWNILVDKYLHNLLSTVEIIPEFQNSYIVVWYVFISFIILIII